MPAAVLLLLTAGAVASGAATHRATWINVYKNSNQNNVPDPATGRAGCNVTCAWDVACAKYNVSLPPNMTLANTAALDWIGGTNYGNMFAYLGLIQEAGMDTVICDFTNGFGMSNSKFPVEQLHRMLGTHYPAMHIVYAVSSSSFKPALAYLDGTSSDTFGYLADQANKPVFILYTTYDQYWQIKQAHPNLRVLFANGEATEANKAGWHGEPYSGYIGSSSSASASLQSASTAYDANEVFFVAPSLDWQPGHPMNASWSMSLPWFAWGLHTLDALATPPWLTVVGSFDDTEERNMWMPALTAWATSKADANMRDNSMLDLDGVPDAGVASVTSSDWTVFYDMVRAYFTRGLLPRGQTSAVAARVPTGVGEFVLGQAETAYTLYVNPPYPFNNGVGDSGQRPAFVRSLSPVYPPGLLFDSSKGDAKGDANGTGPPLLLEFSFQTGLRTTRPAQPLHIMSCTQCGLAVCSEDFARPGPLPGSYVTTSDTLVLPSDLSGVDYASAIDVHDCDQLRGSGAAFVTSGGAGTGIVAMPRTYGTQSLVYSVRQADGRVILYAQATGEVFAATLDFKSVELRRVRGAERHLWTLAAHPVLEGASLISIADGQGNKVVWQAAVGQKAEVCVQGGPSDCLYRIRLASAKPHSLQSAFAFRDLPRRSSSIQLV